ncbi:YncE family protein [Candidatus Pantoea formicae]|uniref:YncE family protein n=1 Tax=Candidatus Pantoea formicae TaxID=2608355 RepID=UPI003ED8A22D
MKGKVMASLMLIASVSVSAATVREALAPALVELAFSPKQNALFVSAPDWKQEDKSRVLRLNPLTLKAEATIAQKVKAFGVALDDSHNRLYVSQGFNGAVGVVDIERNQPLVDIPLQPKINLAAAYRDAGIGGQRLAYLLEELQRFGISDDYLYKVREVKYDAPSGRLFLPGLGYGVDSVLFVVDTRKLQLEKVIPGFGFYATGIAIDEAGRRVFVSNMQGQLMTVNADTLQVTKTQEIEADQLLNLAYDPENNRLLGVDQGIDRDKPRNNYLGHTYTRRSSGHQLFALDADSGKVLAKTDTDQVPIGLLLDTQRQRIYVTNRNGVRVEQGTGTVTVFDARSLKRLNTLNLPPHPNSLALDEANHALFVTVKNDGAATKAGKLESVARIDE